MWKHLNRKRKSKPLKAHNMMARKIKKSIILLNSFSERVCVFDGMRVLDESNNDGSAVQKAIVEDNKGSLATTSITFLLVSVLGVNVYSILFHGWVTMVTRPRRFLGEWFVQGNISEDVYLCECMIKCRANIEYVEPVLFYRLQLYISTLHRLILTS